MGGGGGSHHNPSPLPDKYSLSREVLEASRRADPATTVLPA